MIETYGFERQGRDLVKPFHGRMLTLTRLDTVPEIEPYMDLYQEIWGLDERGRIPAHEPTVAARVGGLFLGVELDREKVGLVYVLPAYDPENGYHHHSNIMGFKAEYQKMGLGMEAKRAHALLAGEMGVKLVTWTFDPFMLPNANLNFRKLGGIVRTYLEDAYGPYGGRYDPGLPTDRFLVEWRLDRERVQTRLRGDWPLMEELCQRGQAAPVFRDPAEEPTASAYRVEVPANLLERAQQDPEAGREEQRAFRSRIQSLLRTGFRVTEFLRETSRPASTYYLLEKSPA